LKNKKKPAPNNAYNGNYQQKLVTACMRNRCASWKKNKTKHLQKMKIEN